MSEKLCVLCGENIATSKEHIPPKAIFIKPIPNNLLTVPSCDSCNRETSKFDQKFQVTISLSVGHTTDSQKDLWQTKAFPTLKKNKSLHEQLLANMMSLSSIGEPVYSNDPNDAAILRLPKNEHDIVINKIIRGLYYIHLGKILPKETPVGITIASRHQGFVTDLLKFLKDVPAYKKGKNFIYKYAVAKENDHRSIWLLQFYDGHFVTCFTDKPHS